MPRLGTSTERGESRPPTAYDEGELVRRAQLGSTVAFEQLVLSRGPDLYRYLAARLRDENDARDALQETLIAAWQGLPDLRRRDRFWPWVVGIASHKAADVARGRIQNASADVESARPDDEDVGDVLVALGRLPRPHREIVLLRYVLQLSEDEAAEALGIRVGTVKSRSARARRALMELLR